MEQKCLAKSIRQLCIITSKKKKLNDKCCVFRTPQFVDEIKAEIPVDIDDGHYLLFTFFHISCKSNKQSDVVETPIGYTVKFFEIRGKNSWLNQFKRSS